jgi:hypothetical protein
MFFGLASGAVDTGGIVVDQVLADIETLNRAAFDGKYEVTAVSFHAYAHLTDRYLLLPHGASMGERYGPVIVARADGPSTLERVHRVAATVACKAAVKAGFPLGHERMRFIVDALMACDTPTTCPHGRVALLRLSDRDIDHRFGRI